MIARKVFKKRIEKMLDGLLKSKFYTKCKSLIKFTRTRLDVLKKKKCSVVKFLKNDMADLLRNGHDYNAFCRAEGLLVEQKMVACYDFIEQFCSCISDNLAIMSKQRECPEECREAVHSLIYAAARIAAFPELRDLRSVFVDRYGDGVEAFVNKEFVEALRPTNATKEMKLQLIHDIAAEMKLEWNPKPLEQKLFVPPSAQENQHMREGLCNADGGNGGRKFRKNKDDDNVSPPKVNKREIASHGKKNCIDEKYNLPRNSDDEMISASRGNSSDLDACSSSIGSVSIGSVSEDEVDSKKPFYHRFVPPYVRPKDESRTEPPSKRNGDVVVEDPSQEDDSSNAAKLKPKSVRRRPSISSQENAGSVDTPLKPPPGREKFPSNGGGGWFGKTNANSAKEEAKPVSTFDETDEEEKMLDALLMQHCKDKRMPNQKQVAKKTREAGALGHRNTKSELPYPPGREAEDAMSRHARSVSMQPEVGSKHVHPNLPNWDDLAARIAALRGR